MNSPAIEKYARTYETLSLGNLNDLAMQLSPDICFRDPFNNVTGRQSVTKIFAHTFKIFPSAKFVVNEVCAIKTHGYIHWNFVPNPKKTLVINGVSRIQVDAQQRISEHIDYWDSASELFAKLPLTGTPTRWLLSRLSTPK